MICFLVFLNLGAQFLSCLFRLYSCTPHMWGSTCGVIKIRTLYECKGIIFSRFVGGFFGWILSTWFHQEVSCKRWVNLPNSNTSKSTVGIMWQTLGGGRTDVCAFAHYFSQSSLSRSHWWQQSFVITILSIESYNNSKRVSTSLLYIYF